MRGKEPTVPLSVCVDCLFYLANGEVTDGEGNDITTEHGAKMQAELGDVEITLGCVDCDTEPRFSWSACDGCGSTLGGNRVHATAWV